jgi:transcriptional regulator with XRE-family HTH domain
MAVVTSIAQRLTTRRKILGVPQKLVAYEIGVSKSAFAKWEGGARAPTLNHAVAWARALGAEIEMTGA